VGLPCDWSRGRTLPASSGRRRRAARQSRTVADSSAAGVSSADVDLERAEAQVLRELLEALQVVVEATTALEQHGQLLMGDVACVHVAAVRREQQMRDVSVDARVPDIDGLDSDAAILEERGERHDIPAQTSYSRAKAHAVAADAQSRLWVDDTRGHVPGHVPTVALPVDKSSSSRARQQRCARARMEAAGPS
jgi:CheY-like chemotaxis protein